MFIPSLSKGQGMRVSGRLFQTLLFLIILAPAVAFSQGLPVRGIVHDRDHRPIPHARVSLRRRQFRRATRANAVGEFRFSAVPAGEYQLAAQASGFQASAVSIRVRPGRNPIFHLMLQIRSQTQQITVTARAARLHTTTSTTQTEITRRRIEHTPGADSADSLAMVTDYVPGAYVVHDMLHLRGGHQQAWFVDGVPVLNTNIASNVGAVINPNNIDQLQVQSGGYSAAHDDRGFGLFNVITPSGFNQAHQAQLIASYGNYRQTNDQLSFGNHTDTHAWYASLDGNFSRLGLYPPVAAVLHDQAAGLGAFLSWIDNASVRDQYRAVVSLQASNDQIPNTYAQQSAGIADRDLERDNLLGLTWTHTVPSGAVFTLAPFYHFNQADYLGGPRDTPFILNDNRRSNYYGVNASGQIPWRGNQIGAGAFLWGEHDDTFFGLTQNPGAVIVTQPFASSADSEEGWAEASRRVLPWLNLNGGLHFTRYAGLIHETAWDPRAGAAVNLPFVPWILHGYYAAYYQPPPLDTISGPLLGFSRRQGYGFIPLHGEHDRQWDIGLTMPLTGWLQGWSLDLDRFATHSANFLDHDEIGNSDIFLPLTDAAARIRGTEASLRTSTLWHWLRLNLVYSNQIAQARGPVTGGLLEFVSAGYFYLDHDQRNTLNAVLTSRLPFRAWAALSVNYGSGFVNGNGPAHLPASSIWGLAAGKNWTDSLATSVNVTNLTNASYLLDNSNTFGGTHWQLPRQFYFELRWRLHY